MVKTTNKAVLLIELVAVLLINQFAADAIGGAAAAAGLNLPSMPLLRHTYLAFSTIVLLILWLRWRREPLASFGLIVPRKWARNLALGFGLAIVSIIVDTLVRSVTTPLLVAWTSADPHLDAKTFAEIKGNLPLYLMILPPVWLFAAFGEEFFYRGYVLSRLQTVLGGGRMALALAIVGQAVLFALGHWYQGPVGMVPIGVGAIVSGIACTAWGRNLWPVIIAHGLVDTLGFGMLYLGLQTS